MSDPWVLRMSTMCRVPVVLEWYGSPVSPGWVRYCWSRWIMGLRGFRVIVKDSRGRGINARVACMWCVVS